MLEPLPFLPNLDPRRHLDCGGAWGSFGQPAVPFCLTALHPALPGRVSDKAGRKLFEGQADNLRLWQSVWGLHKSACTTRLSMLLPRAYDTPVPTALTEAFFWPRRLAEYLVGRFGAEAVQVV